MMRFSVMAAAFASAFLLSACVTTNKVGPYYDASQFNARADARVTFDEAKTLCRDKHLEHHWIGDTRELDIPAYTACMNGYGFAFRN